MIWFWSEADSSASSEDHDSEENTIETPKADLNSGDNLANLIPCKPIKEVQLLLFGLFIIAQ